MSYYDASKDERDDFEWRGIDYDLVACLENNSQEYTIKDIEKVLAVYEGENDGEDWRWILQLKDGRFVFLQGGCDYTGWDCQSWAGSTFTENAEEAAKEAIEGEVPVTADNSPLNAGLGHILALMTGEYNENGQQVFISLATQLEKGKEDTWRQKMDKDFGV